MPIPTLDTPMRNVRAPSLLATIGVRTPDDEQERDATTPDAFDIRSSFMASSASRRQTTAQQLEARQWPAPRSPLPPHRLAKLANALGVSTPLPVFELSAFPSPGLAPPSPTIPPSPSIARPSTPTPNAPPSVSRFFVHVLPPRYLPHASDPRAQPAEYLAPPPQTATGYHVKFRRGVLVGVQPTIPAQLAAIAREYGLPSTRGIILYLVNSNGAADEDGDGCGPRLSEDVWKQLWTRVVRLEEERIAEERLAPGDYPRRPGTHSPYPSQHRPFLASPLLSSAFPSSSSIPSRDGARSAPPYQYPPPSNFPPPGSSSQPSREGTASSTSTESDLDTPATSADLHDMSSGETVMLGRKTDVVDLTEEPASADSSLPRALLSPLQIHSRTGATPTQLSFFPIIAHVEFHIDPQQATWYKPWVRSRRRNVSWKEQVDDGPRKNSLPAKLDLDDRHERKGSLPTVLDTSEDGKRRRKRAPRNLRLRPRQSSRLKRRSLVSLQSHARAKSEGPEGAVDSPDEDEGAWEDEAEVDSDMEFDDFYEQLWAPRAGMSVLTERRRAEEEGQRRVADQEDEARNEELRTQLEQMRQQLKDALEAQQRAEERAGEMAGEYEVDEEGGEGMSLKPGLGRKGAPQPLHLIGTAFGALGPPSSASSEGRKSVQLSYLDDEEGRRRVGVVFDEIVDIGLEASGDFEESDDDDPYDRRKSQIMMKAKLDEIERTLNQLSPAKFKHDEDLPYSPSFSHTASLSPSMIPGVPKYNRDVFPPTPKLGPQMDPPASPRSTDSSWPAVPFSALASPATSTFGSPKLPDNARLGSPEASQGGLPTLAVNGVSTSAPPGFGEVRGNGGDVSAETVKRRKMLEEHESTFTGKRPESSASNVSMQRPQSHRSQSSSSSGYYPAPPKRNDDSPIIPLSPDPFGRSDFSGPGSTYWENPEKGKVLVSIDERIAGGNGGDPEVNSSRFSADSLNGDEKPAPAASASSGNSQRSTIMSVKGIRKLWRKSNKASVSQGVPPVPTQPVAVGRTSSASASSTGRVSPSGSLGRTPSAGASSVLSQPNSRSPTPSRPERPSQELVDLPDPAHQQLGRYSSASSRPSMEQRPSTDGLAPPMAKMMAGNQRQVDMRFDQESPYPTVVPRSRQPSNAMPPPSMQHPSPPSGDEQQGARRSILKSKGGGSISEDKRQRRPSVTSIRASLMNSPPPESIPPSPKLPEHFMPHMRSGSTASKTHNRAESGAHARTLSGATSRSGVSIASRSRMTTPTIDEAMERSGGEQPKSSIDSAKGNVL